MNCHEFTSIDGMVLTFVVSGEGWSGTQVNTSVRPSKRICMQCKSRYWLQDQSPTIPPRKYNACSKTEFHALAARRDAGCFRFRTTKLPWHDDISIHDHFGEPFYLSFQESYLTDYVYPPLLKPWREDDPYYYRSLLYYNAMKALPYGRLHCKMWLRAANYPFFGGSEINFSEFETGSVGVGESMTVALTVSIP